jgi:hypothetical protein
MWRLSIVNYNFVTFTHHHITCAHSLTQHLHTFHRFLSPLHSWRAQYGVHNIS